MPVEIAEGVDGTGEKWDLWPDEAKRKEKKRMVIGSLQRGFEHPPTPSHLEVPSTNLRFHLLDGTNILCQFF